MRLFLLDAQCRDDGVRLLLLDERNEKLLITCATNKRIVYVVPDESITSNWIEHVLRTLQRFSNGMPRDFTHAVVSRRYMTNGVLSDPTDVLRVECSGHLTFSAGSVEGIRAVFGLTSPLLEHVLVNCQLYGWLDFDAEAAMQLHRRVYAANDLSLCLKRCPEQRPPPRPRAVAVYRHLSDSFAYALRDGRSRDWLDAAELVADLKAHDPAVVCVHGRDALVGVQLDIPHVVVDTAAFARDHKLCYTKYLDDAVPVVEPELEVVDCDDDFEPNGVIGVVHAHNGRERCAAIFAIVDRTNAIDLTLEVATITGQPWSQTLRLESKLGRADWMIMNIFHANDCVIPDPRKYTQPQQYTAGLVLEARTGVHENVLLLDFRSLYPSVVVEYKLCWSSDGLILPRMLEYLIDRRAELAGQPNSEIARLCLKLLANMTYGALAYPAFRFYSPDIAATITAHGRQALQDTVRIVEMRFPCTVIYGDTDSVFVTTTGNHEQVAREILSAVNAGYTKLELEYEAMYERLYLVGKKCYVAFKRGSTEPTLKGLAMVKKQYFDAGKQLCRRLVDSLRSPGDYQAIFEATYADAQRFLVDLRAERVPREHLVIVNMLKRRLVDYDQVNTAGMHHVLAAKASRLVFERGDYVRYLMFENCTAVLLDVADEMPHMSYDAKWYCNRLYSMLDQILRILPGYTSEPLSRLLQHSDVYESEVPARVYTPQARCPLLVYCVTCQEKVEHWGLAEVEQRAIALKCDTVLHLSPRCIFPEKPLSYRLLNDCSACGCVLDLFGSARSASNGEAVHANYDCRRVARQVDCEVCRRNLLQFFKTTGLLARYDAICEVLFTW